MKKIMKNILISAFLILVGTVGAMTLYSTDDVFIASFKPDDNFDGEKLCLLAYYKNFNLDDPCYLNTVIKFDDVLTGQKILRLYCEYSSPIHFDSHLVVSAICNDWEEESVTWNSFNQSLGTSSVIIDDWPQSDEWFEIDVTNIISEHGVRIGITSPNSIFGSPYCEFHSSEYDINAPELVISNISDNKSNIESSSLGQIKATYK